MSDRFSGHVRAATVPTDLADAVSEPSEIGRYSSGNYRIPHGNDFPAYQTGWEVFSVHIDAVSVRRAE